MDAPSERINVILCLGGRCNKKPCRGRPRPLVKEHEGDRLMLYYFKYRLLMNLQEACSYEANYD